MAATSTLRQILIELVERNAWGKVIPVGSNTTTTFTLTTTGSPELRGPFTGAKIAIGSPVVCTVETSGTSALGNRTFVSNWAPSTGVLTVSPAIGDTDVTEIIVFNPDVMDPDRAIEAVNRALLNRVKRVQKVPLTYVEDGELLGAVASAWTASAGTATYASATTNEVAGAQVLNLNHSGSANVTSDTIPARPGEVWRFETAIRATTASGVTAGFVVVDVTNTSTITPSFETGDGDTTSNAFMTQMGTFTVPTNCDQIAFRLTLSASGTVQMAPITAYPQDARSFPLSNRVTTTQRVGNFFYSRGRSTDSGPDERSFTPPITTMGRTHGFSNNGDHLVVDFNFCPTSPVYYDEVVFGSALTAMTDTTPFPVDQVVKWATFELEDQMMRQEIRQRARAENGTPLPPFSRPLRNAALKSAENSTYEPEMMTVVGRR